eukprot:3258539-Pleurochrysis_carterae.AAC.1
MSEHVWWFMGQRKALKNMRQESGRQDTLFEQAWLGRTNCPDLDNLWEQLAYLRKKLATSEYACNKIELMTQL